MKRFFAALLIVLLIALAFAAAEQVEIVGGVQSVAVPSDAQTVEAAAQQPGPTIQMIPAGTPEADVQPAPTATPEPTKEPGRLEGLLIGIDPGHQAHANSDKEAVAPNSKEKKAKVSSGTSGVSTGTPEYVVNLEVGLKLRDALEALGARVLMTRDVHEIDISNQERAFMMNEANADLVLRIHCDGANDRSVHGTTLYVRKTGERQTECKAAADVLIGEMCAVTGAKNRGVCLRDTYTMNNWSTVPCILVEMGFMSNREEDEKLCDPNYQDLLVEGMVNGICAYFER